MIAAPVVAHVFQGFDPDNHPSATALVNWSLFGISYIQIYVGLALTGSLSAIVMAISRLLAARRASKGALYSPDDIESSTNLTVMGVVPAVPPTDVGGQINDPRSILRESYYSTITALQFATETGAPKIILITSSRPSEGKSTTALGIAVCFAAKGKRVLLMDADLRNPTLHRRVGLGSSSSEGTSSALSRGDWEGALHHVSSLKLDVMGVGSIPPDPAALLARGFEPLLRKLAPHYDHVLIDGPPVMQFADAPILSKEVDETLFVVSSGQTHRSVVAALGRLGLDEEPCPCVLTKYQAKMVEYGSYDYAYSYIYGDNSTTQAKMSSKLYIQMRQYWRKLLQLR